MKNHKYVVFINGPPHSGKDTAAHFIFKEFMAGPWYAQKMKVSTPLKKAAHALFHVSRTAEKMEIDGEKDVPSDDFFGNIPRQVYIDLSERHAKSLYGPGFFGRILGRRLIEPSLARLTIVSDAGFSVEVAEACRIFGPQQCFIMRLHRDGTSFDGDSRDYLDVEGVDSVDIMNKFELDLFDVQVNKVVKQWLRV